MFEGRDSFRGVPDPKFFLAADGADSDGVAADIALTVLNRVVHVYESNGAVQAAYAITLPPVGESVGLLFSFMVVEDISSYFVTIEDQDESFDWNDIVLTADNETVVLYSDGRRWHVLSRYPVARTQAITSSGAQVVTPGVAALTLAEDTTAIAATIADAALHEGLFIVSAILEPNAGQDHTLTLTSGTFNGTNNIATFADIDDALMVYFDASGKGTVLVNVGAVALS